MKSVGYHLYAGSLISNFLTQCLISHTCLDINSEVQQSIHTFFSQSLPITASSHAHCFSFQLPFLQLLAIPSLLQINFFKKNVILSKQPLYLQKKYVQVISGIPLIELEITSQLIWMVILTQEELFSEMTDTCDRLISHNAPYLLIILEASPLGSFRGG